MNKGNIIAELRREAGYTQKSLADALHITDKAVSKWERGLSLPDVALLPRLSLLLDADVELLLSQNKLHKGWVGLLDLRTSTADLRRPVYDKPMVYYMLSHYLLLDIREIYVFCSQENREYLSGELFKTLGFSFVFDCDELPQKNLMIMDQPSFLFGSDLTRQYQGAMVSDTVMKLVPEKQRPPFLFCPVEYSFMYLKNPDYLYEIAVNRTLGRGMICLPLEDLECAADAAAFVRMYQNHTGLLIGSLEEIAWRKGLISAEQLRDLADGKDYEKLLRSLSETQAC